MSIHPILQKIKAFILQVESEAYVMVIIIILVGLAGFGLGKLSAAGESTPIIIQTGTKQIETSPLSSAEPNKLAGADLKDSISNTGSIVASKNGSKYYFY